MQNPIDEWATGTLVMLGLSCAALVIAAAAAIHASDRPIRAADLRAPDVTSSAALEWVLRPSDSERLVSRYAGAGLTGDVVRGVLLDSVFFVPAYVALLTLLCFAVARALPPPLSDLELTLGWAVVVAGGLDLIENAGIVAQLLVAWSFASPLTGIVCRLKWTLVVLAGCGVALGSLIGLVRRMIGG